VAITADADEERIAEIVTALDPDAVQLSGDEPPKLIARVGRPAWKALHLPAEDPGDVAAAAARVVELGREHLAAGATRLLLDTAGGPHPGGTGTRAAPPLVAPSPASCP
jgi:phosphoribosylanthranilate isomerase